MLAPRRDTPERAPLPPEPTPLDNLLAVAELEFHQQRGDLERLEGARPHDSYSFLPGEEVARDVMSFDLGEPKAGDDMFFDHKAPALEHPADDDAFASDLVSHKDLFESISEAHYLPELGGPHDEALLESLVEKGCEDNQILGQALDKLAHMVSASGEYVEEEDILLNAAPVSDIIDRLDALESPSRSSMTAAQGLLHLHHIGDQLPPRKHTQSHVEDYITAEVFAPETEPECPLDTHDAAPEVQENDDVNHLEYEQNAEKRLQSNGEPAEEMYTEQVPDLHETFEDNQFEDTARASPKSPERDDIGLTHRSIDENIESDVVEPEELEKEVEQCDVKSSTDPNPSVGEQSDNSNECIEVPTDLSLKCMEAQKIRNKTIRISAETTLPVDTTVIKTEELPKDLTVHRRLPTPLASPILLVSPRLLASPRILASPRQLPSPRRIEIPRAPSRESDSMQSPQPSGIPAIASPEVFQAPLVKSKTQSVLDAVFASTSPKIYLTSEVSITKQPCEPMNLGKNRKSASPTVSSCTDANKNFGEPSKKRQKRDSEKEIVSPLKQLLDLKANKNFNIPDPLLVPKDRFMSILIMPGKEIPALLVDRPELRLGDDNDYSNWERDPDIVVISLERLEQMLTDKDVTCTQTKKVPKPKGVKQSKTSSSDTVTTSSTSIMNTENINHTSQPRSVPSLGALAEDIDAATSASIPQVFWYAQQLEAMSACSQNSEFLKALNATEYAGMNYSDLSQMLLNHQRLMSPPGFPMIPPVDYNRMHTALWQEMMVQKMASTHKRKSSAESQMKDAAPKTNDFPNHYGHSNNKSYQGRAHTSSRTSPGTNSYSNQRAFPQHALLQGMYPGLGGVRPNVPMGGLNVPYFNPSAMGSQRSPRTPHQRSPTPTPPSPSYYANNNYLQSLKHLEHQHHHRSAASPVELPHERRPRISVKKVDDLRRRREETEVNGTSPMGEQAHLTPDASAPLWHPLFGNQKSYTSPWSWTTVTATGD